MVHITCARHRARSPGRLNVPFLGKYCPVRSSVDPARCCKASQFYVCTFISYCVGFGSSVGTAALLNVMMPFMCYTLYVLDLLCLYMEGASGCEIELSSCICASYHPGPTTLCYNHAFQMCSFLLTCSSFWERIWNWFVSCLPLGFDLNCICQVLMAALILSTTCQKTR